MYRNEFLLIIWEKGESRRDIDLLPSRMIMCPVISKASHGFVTDEGKGFKYHKAEYNSMSMGNTVTVNYTNDFNIANKIETGEMKLIFDSVSKDSLLEVHWKKDHSKPYKKYSANARWITLIDISPTAQETALKDIVKWLAWK
jgi:hypothetical protein